MTDVDWDPDQYRRFEAERARPFWDLVDLVHRGGIDRAVDLGCGPGGMTAAVAQRLGVSHMTGIDNSPSMLEQAEHHGRVEVTFQYGDISRWTSDRDHDLVLANAALHWVPEHEAVLERWVAALAPEGQIAVQVPANHDHAAHLATAHVARQEPFASAFDGEPPPDPVATNVLAPERYATLLYELGLREPVVRLQVYPHVFGDPSDVVDWLRGSALMRFFRRLPPDLHEPFVDACRDEMRAQIGRQSPYLYTFKRILMWGRKSA